MAAPKWYTTASYDSNVYGLGQTISLIRYTATEQKYAAGRISFIGADDSFVVDVNGFDFVSQRVNVTPAQFSADIAAETQPSSGVKIKWGEPPRPGGGG